MIRSYWFLILVAFTLMVLTVNYFYVDEGDTFIDETGKQFKVISKNFLFCKIKGFLEEKTVSILHLVTHYEKDE